MTCVETASVVCAHTSAAHASPWAGLGVMLALLVPMLAIGLVIMRSQACLSSDGPATSTPSLAMYDGSDSGTYEAPGSDPSTGSVPAYEAPDGSPSAPIPTPASALDGMWRWTSTAYLTNGYPDEPITIYTRVGECPSAWPTDTGLFHGPLPRSTYRGGFDAQGWLNG